MTPLPCKRPAWEIEITEAEEDGDAATIVAPAGLVVRGRRPGTGIQPRG
jgi:hypothetical protein